MLKLIVISKLKVIYVEFANYEGSKHVALIITSKSYLFVKIQYFIILIAPNHRCISQTCVYLGFQTHHSAHRYEYTSKYNTVTTQSFASAILHWV